MPSWGPIEELGWIYLAAIGLCLLGAQILIVFAYRQATAVKLGPLIYSVIVFTALINWLIWAHPPTLLELAGMTLVIFGGIIAVAQPCQPAAQNVR